MHKDRETKEFTRQINFTIPNYDDIGHTPIRKLFSTTHDPNMEIEYKSQKMFIKDVQTIDLSNPLRIHTNKEISYYLSDGLSKTENSGYINNPNLQEIFMSDRAEGHLESRILVRFHKNSFYINIRNHYSFLGTTTLNSYVNPIVIVTNKDDQYFRRLNRFKYISL